VDYFGWRYPLFIYIKSIDLKGNFNSPGLDSSLSAVRSFWGHLDHTLVGNRLEEKGTNNIGSGRRVTMSFGSQPPFCMS
jgi:hypothetical protein